MVSLKTPPPVVGKDLSSPVLLLEEQGVGAPYQTSQPVGTAPEKQAPKNI